MMIIFGVASLVRQTRVMHSHFRARPFVVGVLDLRSERGMPCECWYFLLPHLVWIPHAHHGKRFQHYLGSQNTAPVGFALHQSDLQQ